MTVPTRMPRRHLPRLMWGMLHDRGRTFARLARSHPDGVTVPLPGRPLHVLTRPEAVTHVLVDAARRYEKGMGQAEARAGLGHGLLTAEGETWARSRQDVVPLLAARRVQRHAVSINDLAVASVARLATPRPRLVPVGEALAEYTVDCLAVALGVPSPSAARVARSLGVVQDDAMFRATTQDRVPAALRPVGESRLRRARAELDAIADRLRCAVHAETPGPPPAWATRDGVISLLLAGYETTASTLTWAVEELSRRPELTAALAAEREAAGETPHDREGVLHLMGRLPLTTAVVKEVLRVHPPVWLLTRRAVCDDVVAGWPVRAGDDVCIVTSEVQREGWDSPDAFDPTRFLPPARLGRYAPFGRGPRGCPGGALADLEATLWLAEAARQLELRPVLGRRTGRRARMSMTVAEGTTYQVCARASLPRPTRTGLASDR